MTFLFGFKNKKRLAVIATNNIKKMPKKKKKIETLKIEVLGKKINFIEILSSAEKIKYQEGKEKCYTLYKLEDNEDYYSGYVSTTKLSDIAPKHNSNTNEYERLPINSKEGEGLGYSNVFIYDKKFNILMYEFNTNGCYVSSFSRYLKSEFEKKNETKIAMQFSPVLRKEAYQRMLSFSLYKSIEMQIATPSRSVDKYYEENDGLTSYIKDGQDFNAERVSVKFDIPGKPFKGLRSERISNLLEKIKQLKNKNPEDIIEKLSVTGYYLDPDDSKTKKDSIDLILDRYIKYFSVDQPYVLINPQTKEKSYALLEVYLKSKKDFMELFKTAI